MCLQIIMPGISKTNYNIYVEELAHKLFANEKIPIHLQRGDLPSFAAHHLRFIVPRIALDAGQERSVNFDINGMRGRTRLNQIGIFSLQVGRILLNGGSLSCPPIANHPHLHENRETHNKAYLYRPG